MTWVCRLRDPIQGLLLESRAFIVRSQFYRFVNIQYMIEYYVYTKFQTLWEGCVPWQLPCHKFAHHQMRYRNEKK
jgi:hypothetical protein